MKRKIVKQGGAAYTITLPVNWIRSNNLDAGSEVEVEECPKKVVIRTDKKQSTGKVKIDYKNMSKWIRYVYNSAAYIKGADELELKTNNNFIPEFDQNIGYVIINQNKDIITVKDVGGPSANLDEMFKRLFQMIIAFQKDIVELIESKKELSEAVIRQKDGEVNKFTAYLQRAVMKHEKGDINGRILFAYSFVLEQIGDEIIRAYRESNKMKLTPGIKKINDLVSQTLQDTFTAFYDTSHEKKETILRAKDKIREMCDKEIQKNNYRYLCRCIKIVELCSDLNPLTIMNQLKVHPSN